MIYVLKYKNVLATVKLFPVLALRGSNNVAELNVITPVEIVRVAIVLAKEELVKNAEVDKFAGIVNNPLAFPFIVTAPTPPTGEMVILVPARI